MKNEIDILLDVVKKLNSIDVDYMLTGSLAMNYYAQPRMTRDVDLIVELSELKVQEMVDAFKSDYYISKDSILEAIDPSVPR